LFGNICMGNFPVLTARTQEITPKRTQGEPLASREEMKERFDFNGRDTFRGDFSINQRIELPVHIFSSSTESRLPWCYLAPPLADLALHNLVF